jgi:putative zinc finger/helix-turn-helix YgiT family protein
MNETTKTMCPSCGEGNIISVKRDYIAHIGDGETLRIPNVTMEICDKCGEEIFSIQTARTIDAAIAEHTELLLPKELTEIRMQFKVDQTEMSEALGLGAKTYHRWEKGSQYPSRSMGYYLRLLREFPEVFEWLRLRQWRGRNRIATCERSPLEIMQIRFPNLPANRLNALVTDRRNCALTLFSTK